MKSARRTVVTMLLAEGDTGRTVFGVFQARVRYNARGDWSWDINKAKRVGNVIMNAGDRTPGYLEMARIFETPYFPAFEGVK